MSPRRGPKKCGGPSAFVRNVRAGQKPGAICCIDRQIKLSRSFPDADQKSATADTFVRHPADDSTPMRAAMFIPGLPYDTFTGCHESAVSRTELSGPAPFQRAAIVGPPRPTWPLETSCKTRSCGSKCAEIVHRMLYCFQHQWRKNPSRRFTIQLAEWGVTSVTGVVKASTFPLVKPQVMIGTRPTNNLRTSTAIKKTFVFG